jgi:hypothetical protein
VPRDQHDRYLLPYSRISIPEPLLFLSSSSSVVPTRLSGPVPDPLLPNKSGMQFTKPNSDEILF